MNDKYNLQTLSGSISIGKGDKGDQGIQGEKGEKGDKGDNNVCIGLTPTSEAEIWFDTNDGISGEEIATKKFVEATNEELSSRLDNLIISNGDGNKDSEIIDARDGETTLGNKIRKIDESLEHKANKTIADNLQSQINSLVLESGGDSNLEVVQARTDIEGNVFPSLKNNSDNISDLLFNMKFKKSYGDWVQGAIQYDGTTNTDSKFIRTADFHVFTERTVLTPASGVNYRVIKYNIDGSINDIANFSTSRRVFTTDNYKYKLVVGKVDGSTIIPAESGLISLNVDRDIKYSEKGATFINVSNNLVDNKHMKLNTLINASTGLEEANPAYACTDFIPYRLGDEIFVSRYRNYVMYNANKEKILVNTTTTTDKSMIKITSSSMIDVAYIRFSVYIEYASETIVSHTDYSTHSEYGLFIDKLRIKNNNLSDEVIHYINGLIPEVVNPLLGMTVYGFGDSLMAGHYSGEGIMSGLVNENKMIYNKYAKNGATVIEGSNSILSQISSASATVPDLIVFDGSTNDAYNSTITSNLGALTDHFNGDYTTSTFYGAFEQICYNLREKYMDSNIIYITPHKMPTRSQDAQNRINQAVLEICNKWQIPVVDIYNKGQINCYMSNMRNKYSYDNQGETSGGNGTHLTGIGYDKWYKPQVKSKILELI